MYVCVQSTTTMTRKEKEKEARIEANKLSARVRKAIASGEHMFF